MKMVIFDQGHESTILIYIINFFSGTVCKTKDNHQCIFPFEYEDHNFSTCNDQPRKDLPRNSFWCPIDENYKSVGVCREHCPKSKDDILINFHIPRFLILVCRLSSGSACNIYGTNNCSTNLCNCITENEGDLCENCNWRKFSFVSNGIEGTIDPINGYGVTCQKGILFSVFRKLD